jgi:hypothetical protein
MRTSPGSATGEVGSQTKNASRGEQGWRREASEVIAGQRKTPAGEAGVDESCIKAPAESATALRAMESSMTRA